MNPEESDLLSARGAARRREILNDALRAADGRRRKRMAVRAGVGITCAAAVIVAIAGRWAAVPADNVGGHELVVQPTKPIMSDAPTRPTTATMNGDRSIIVLRPPPARPAVRIEVVRDDPAVRRWEVLNDDQFLTALADAGQPSGLVRVNGVTKIVRQ